MVSKTVTSISVGTSGAVMTADYHAMATPSMDLFNNPAGYRTPFPNNLGFVTKSRFLFF
jgi:hypothetical protein